MKDRFRVDVEDKTVIFHEPSTSWEIMKISFKMAEDAFDCAKALIPLCDAMNSMYINNEDLNEAKATILHRDSRIENLKRENKDLWCKIGDLKDENRVLKEKLNRAVGGIVFV